MAPLLNEALKITTRPSLVSTVKFTLMACSAPVISRGTEGDDVSTGVKDNAELLPLTTKLPPGKVAPFFSTLTIVRVVSNADFFVTFCAFAVREAPTVTPPPESAFKVTGVSSPEMLAV